jgi:hypothetical protein
MEADMDYQGYDIESFEAGKGLWHARIRRADQKPLTIDGVLFPTLEVGFAWSSRDAAVADAKIQIDFLNRRSTLAAPNSPAGFSVIRRRPHANASN